MPRVLVVEDNPITRKLVRFTLRTQGFDVVEAERGEDALRAFAENDVSIVLLDLILPDMDGVELLGRLRQLPRAAEIPILAFTGFLPSELHARISAAGFDDVVTKPIEPSRLVQIVRAHLPPSEPAEVRIRTLAARRLVIADDDAVQRKLVKIRLQRAGYEVVPAADGQDALERARELRPDAIISDVLMPNLDGFGLCVAVRNDPELRDTPVLLITNSYLEPADRELARRAGATDLVVRTPELREVMLALEEALEHPTKQTGPTALDPEVERERIRRVMNQLERQVALHTGATQRSTLLAAELAVLSGIAEAIATHRDIDTALRQVLAACLDAGGISLGALYLVGETTERKIISLGATNGWAPGDLEGFFGERAWLEGAITKQATLVVPSAFDDPRSQAVIERAGVQSLLVVPLAHHGESLGALIMMSRTTDLNTEDRIVFARTVAGQVSLAIAVTDAFHQRAASERAARSQATLLRSILESMADGVIVANERGEITHWNSAADRVLPVTPTRTTPWAGRNTFHADRTTPVQPNDLPLARALRGESVDHLELFVQQGGTEGVWYSVNARPLRDDSGVVPGGVAVFRDVTTEKATNARLLLGDRMAALGTLAAGVAHEINNPLMAVTAGLEMLASDVAEMMRGTAVNFNETLSLLHDARDAAERVRHIVRDMKLFSRVDEETPGRVDVEHVIESSIRMVATEIRHRARLVRDYSPISPVLANESRLGQVFLNILVNASQALPEGRADRNEIRISTSMTSEGRVRIAIADTGTGMSPEVAARIFTPFFTTKPIGVGTGLGLAICHQLIQAIGGNIDVETMVGQGTTFVITLPAMTAEHDTRSVTQPVATVAKRRGRVLIIDDDALITATLRRGLSSEHDIVALIDPREAARRILGGERFDMILCDLMMPTGTGMDLYDELIEVAPDQAANIVFITGGAFTPRAREFLDAVPNPRLDKPFSLHNLRAMINDRLAAT